MYRQISEDYREENEILMMKLVEKICPNITNEPSNKSG